MKILLDHGEKHGFFLLVEGVFSLSFLDFLSSGFFHGNKRGEKENGSEGLTWEMTSGVNFGDPTEP